MDVGPWDRSCEHDPSRERLDLPNRVKSNMIPCLFDMGFFLAAHEIRFRWRLSH